MRKALPGMSKKSMLAVALCAVVFAAVSAGSAFAGEVKGPPGQANNTNETGALDHANSACAASGLNDFDSEEGQNVSQVQTAADSWKYYGLRRVPQARSAPARAEPRNR